MERYDSFSAVEVKDMNAYAYLCPFWQMNQIQDIFTTLSNHLRSSLSENTVSCRTSTSAAKQTTHQWIDAFTPTPHPP